MYLGGLKTIDFHLNAIFVFNYSSLVEDFQYTNYRIFNQWNLTDIIDQFSSSKQRITHLVLLLK